MRSWPVQPSHRYAEGSIVFHRRDIASGNSRTIGGISLKDEMGVVGTGDYSSPCEEDWLVGGQANGKGRTDGA